MSYLSRSVSPLVSYAFSGSGSGSGSGSSAGASSSSARNYPRYSELYTLIDTVTVLRTAEDDGASILCQKSKEGEDLITRAMKCAQTIAKIEDRLLSQARRIDLELLWHTERATSSA